MDFKKFREFEDRLNDGNYVMWEGYLSKGERTNEEKKTLDLRSIIEPKRVYEGISHIPSVGIGIKLTPEILIKLGFTEKTRNGFATFEIGKLILTEYNYRREVESENEKMIADGGIGLYCIYDEKLQKEIFSEPIDDSMCRIGKKFVGTEVAQKSYLISTIHALQNYLQKYPKITSKRKIDFDKIVPQLKSY